MVDDFLRFVNNNDLIDASDRILVAVSGGIDSVVMASLFHQSPYNWGIAHCNFQLRGKESDDDEKFVVSLAQRYKVPVYCKAFNTKIYAKENRFSTQMAARNLRYEWFKEMLEKEGYTKIATAHQINDSIETFLFNFSKGTGYKGLKGISRINREVIRPMLFTNRTAIKKYAEKIELEWREDSSNSSDDYSRNYIRHKAVPVLKDINNSIENTSISTFERLQDAFSIIDSSINDLRNKCVSENSDGTTTISTSSGYSTPGFSTILHEIIREFGFNYTQAQEVFLTLQNSGRRFESETHELIVDREKLIITKLEYAPKYSIKILKTSTEIKTDFGILNFEWNSEIPMSFMNDQNTAFVDLNKLQFPLKLRNWEAGDAFQPLGMKHKKKLSDFMIDRKIPLNLKKQALVLESDNKIVWVVGQQIDDRFKLTEQSKSVCKITFRKQFND